MVLNISLLVLAYLVGGIPSGLLVARLAGNLDIRQIGSGNIGTTNVYRALGLRWALVTFFADALKGFLPVFIAAIVTDSAWWSAGACLFSVLGHMFSPYLGLRGGKGVATAFGAMLYLVPVAALIDLALWAILAFPFKIVSAASLAAAAALPVLVFLLSAVIPYRVLALCLALIIIVSHHENIRRLIQGEEKPVS